MTVYPIIQLQDIIFILYGKALKEENRFENGTYKVYGSNGEVGLHNECLINEPTIIIGRKGSVGKITFAEKGGWIIDTAFFIKIKNPDLVCLRYLFYALQQANLMQHTIVTSIPGISRDSILNIKIPLPSLSVQKEIVAILEKSENLKQKSLQIEKKLNALAQSIFLEMFGDPASNPKQWNKSKIGELMTVQTGSTPKRNIQTYYNGDIPWIKTGEVQGTAISKSQEYISEQAIKESNCKVFPKKTILLAMYGQGKTRGRVGYLTIEAATNQACAAILPSSKINQMFLFYYLKTQYVNLRALGRGGNQENLNLSMVKNYEICVPPMNMQTNFIEFIDIIEKIVCVNNKMKLKADELLKTFLNKYFNDKQTAKSKTGK